MNVLLTAHAGNTVEGVTKGKVFITFSIQIQTFDYPVIVNDTGNDILLSTSYYLYHYLLPYKAWHAPHMLAQILSFSKSIDLLLLGEV